MGLYEVILSPYVPALVLDWTGLTNGSLANLRALDLRENELRDDGADKIAHMMIANVFSTISVLRLQRLVGDPSCGRNS